ncbi:MFS transporter [Xanthomonas translucens]|uniref:MFS transporter n=1 Tax=Xanthomonas campestris pv. translucens TaxID=343 RepID=UPI000D201061|nr:MFS transporter [Xanthomonas translucens]AVY66385.1 MFS transporter [Xanthomonas translucens pv. undulosa]
MTAAALPASPINSQHRVLLASLVGTTIEFFDFYIYATAAVLVFPTLFFPAGDADAARLQSLATFAVAFVARPVGSALFGHFGDRIGRKATLVAALLTMGLSTVVIGLLPGYASIGVWAPALLTLCRFGQGLGLGGEWGGAVLLATENAPPGRRAWYGMFPQLGAPLGFLLSSGIFLLLDAVLDDAQFMRWGWRIPFVASALLVVTGLWVRLRIHETPDFRKALERNARVALPMWTVLSRHAGALLLGSFGVFATFMLFYLITVFALGYGTSVLGYGREQFLLLQMVGILFLAAGIPLSAHCGDRYGTHRVMIAASLLIILFGLGFAPLFGAAHPWQLLAFLSLGSLFMGLTYGPCGTLLAELYPVQVRYTGASLSFNLAGIIGAAPAPYVASWLAKHYGLPWVGSYLSAGAALSLFALLAIGARRR